MKLLAALLESFDRFWNGYDEPTPEETARFIEQLRAQKLAKRSKVLPFVSNNANRA